MLFHTTLILLHRPFRAKVECQGACRDAAKQIEMQLFSFEQTYGLSKGKYVMAYCTYTAATVAVQDTIAGLQGARKGLDTFVRALNSIRESCPCIQRSIDIISECQSASVHQSGSRMAPGPRRATRMRAHRLPRLSWTKCLPFPTATRPNFFPATRQPLTISPTRSRT